MNKAYNKITFKNNQAPDLDADNMNAISTALDTIDNRAIQLNSDLVNYENTISTHYVSANLFNKNSDLVLVNKFVQSSGNYTTLNGSYVSHPIKIKKATSYTFNINTGYYGSNALIVRICQSDGTLTLGSVLATNNGDGTATFTVPTDGYTSGEYVCVNIRNIATMMFVEGTTMPSYVEYYDYTKINDSVLPQVVKSVNNLTPDANGNVNISSGNNYITNPLYGKKLSLNGDSICYGAGSVGGYGSIIAQNNGMTLTNNAQTGGTITSGTTYSGGGNRHWICRTIANMPTDSDYYILEGGSNDIALAVTLGSITSGYNSSLDDSTFYGAMESVCKQMITRFKGKKYGFLIVHQMKGGIRITNDMYSAIIACCEKWGIPYLDLAKNCVPFGLFETDWGNELSALRNTYTSNGDGWHPTEECYQKYYVPKIEAWMRTL